ncbi:MAG: deoxyribose-phosphate aldolase [Candidatus Gastranaerophilales bacterium]|nr:deoxyribose-phosphate aldolase [Candidatus Gastranaerophilales bacterium]
MKIQDYIEHTILKPDATYDEIFTVLAEAAKHNFRGVCINPYHVALASGYLKNTDVKVVTVVGFPLGANETSVKVFETQQAIKAGADEIDMVINITALKSEKCDLALNDIKEVVKASGDKPVKVIFETDLLTKEEIEKACQMCITAGAKFVKTSTGFVKNGVGAKVEDVALMHSIVKDHGIEVKASGGIRSYEDAKKLIDAGATRIGTSSGVKILQESEAK